MADFMDHRSAIKREIEKWKQPSALGAIGTIIDNLDITTEEKEKLDTFAYNAQNIRQNYVNALERLLDYVQHD